MRTTKDFLRFSAIASLLLAGSCAAPFNDGSNQVTDPTVNHPISVEPSYHSIKLPFSATDAGLMPEDAAHFSVFVAEYLNSGNGAISITAPAGGNAAIGYFGERLASLGVPRDRILVGTKQTSDGDNRVEIGYVGYKAHVENCDDPWSKDWADTADNQPTANFGCAVQRNIAAMVADPRDLVQPRTMDASDAVRRNTVMGHYEKGEITQADKRTSDKAVEQSGESSSIQ